MSTLSLECTLVYGATTPTGAVPIRIPLSYTVEYTEESCKTVRVAAAATDTLVQFDTVTAPKFLLVRSLEGTVTLKLGDGTTTVISGLTEEDGYILIACPAGQDIDRVLVTTPASPSSGALIDIKAFE